MNPLLMGLLSAGASPIIDLFTGASGKQRAAQDAQKAQLQAIMDRINGEMGNNAADSLSYKTAMAANDKSYKVHQAALDQNNAATGASDEAKLGQMATMNDGYNSAQLSALSQADQQRKNLQAQYDQVAEQQAALGVQRADNAVNNQNQLIGGAMSLVPYLMDNGTGYTSANTQNVAEGVTPAPTVVNPSVVPTNTKAPQQVATSSVTPAALTQSLKGAQVQIDPSLGTAGYFSNSGTQNRGTSALKGVLGNITAPRMASNQSPLSSLFKKSATSGWRY